MLPSFGLTASDDGQTPGIVLGTLTGNRVIVGNLTELWAAAETLGRKPVDPLDPRFTAADAGPIHGGH